MKRFALCVLWVALAGCLDQFRGGEGEESFTVVNADSRTVEVVPRIRQVETDIVVFSEDLFLAPGQAESFVLGLRPGQYVLAVTTSTHIDERLPMEIPTRGDTSWTLTLDGGTARLSRS